jgi:hypothetical protein
MLAGLMALLVCPTHLLRSAIVLKPSTLLALHQAISKRKYRMLFSPNRRRKPGPKTPRVELIYAVIEMKQCNLNWGCPRIAQQMALAFHIQIDKDVVRRILAHHYLPGQDSDGVWSKYCTQEPHHLERGAYLNLRRSCMRQVLENVLRNPCERAVFHQIRWILDVGCAVSHETL